MKTLYLISLLLPVVLSYNTELNPLSDEFIDYINSKQSTWIAGRNFDEHISIEEIKSLLGAKRRDPSLRVAKEYVHSENIEVPDSFDARTNWKECTHVISTIADQSSCGSCWAVAAASAMSDRRCIASKGKITVPVSANDLLSCCRECGGGCNGGYPEEAWMYWKDTGISTGGLYNSNQGCKSYPFQPCEHHTEGNKVQCSSLNYETPACSKKCDSSKLDYKTELTFASGYPNYFRKVADIQKEILTHGPVEAGFNVYEDFVNYKSGVYQHVAGKFLGGHAVRVIGWGEEKGTPYWLVANSWNEDWGEKGLFKIIRGRNEVGFEGEIVAAPAKI